METQGQETEPVRDQMKNVNDHEPVNRTGSAISTCSTNSASSRGNSKSGSRKIRKSIRNLPTDVDVLTIQEKFRERFVKTFLRKKAKYEYILRENSVNVGNNEDNIDADFDRTFEEEVEIIVSNDSESTVNCAPTTWRRRSGNGRKYSLRKLFRRIYVVVRRTKARRIINKLSDISTDDLSDLLDSISSELSIAYQYQIAILVDDAELFKAADYAVSCIMSYLRSKQSLFNATEALQAVTEVTPKHYFLADEQLRTKIVKTGSIKGKRHQHWVLDELFKQPGVRLPEANGDGYKYYECFTPYGYSCRPEKYGFRGPLHVWNETEKKYTMIPNDVISCCSPRRCEVEFDRSNVHHSFFPVILCQHG